MAPAEDLTRTLDHGRRCHVTLLFSDLCDYTALSENADPEDVATVLHATKTLALSIIEKHGGTLNQFYGDGLLAVFGLPQGSEDDTRRAAETALELHDSLRQLSFDFALPARFTTRLHSGIHAGLVFARTSDSRDGRYEIVGDPINTAARLCAAAGPDEILGSEAALQGIEPFFELEGIAPLRLKGKYEALPAFRLLRRTGLSTRFEARAARGLTPFVGRARELARLLAAFEGALDGQARLFHVTGDVGVGKTRLLQELEKRIAPRAAVCSGGCESYRRAPPLQPFVQLLAQTFELSPGAPPEESRARVGARCAELAPALAEHVPALERVLGLAPGAGDTPEKIARANGDAIAAVLLALAQQKPLCLMLDDWHSADDASYRLLSRLVDALQDSPEQILIVTVSRFIDPSDPLGDVGERLELGPLDAEEAARAIEALLPNSLDVGIADNIRERSGGNPLFLEELCQAWPYTTRDADGTPASQKVPSLLHGLIQARVERLPPELNRIARAAAVIGNEFELWLLEQVVTDIDLESGLARLSHHSLIRETDRPGIYRYKHGVTRDVVYDSVRIGERRLLHAAIAQAIEARFADVTAHCEALAHHYAGAARPSRAAKYAEMAGDKAAASSSLDQARLHYRGALAELDKLSSSHTLRAHWLGVSRKWAAACVFSPAPEQLEVLEGALRITEDVGNPIGVAHSHYWLGWIHYGLGDQERALEHTERALALAASDEQSRLSTQLLANLGQIQLACAAPREAIATLQRAVTGKHEQARGTSSGSVPVGYVYALGCEGTAHGYLGDFASAHGCLRSALETINGRQHAIEASLLGLLAMVQVWQADYPECAVTTERMSKIAVRVGGPYVFAMSRTFGGYARWMCQRDPSALDELVAAVDWIEERGMRLFHSLGLSLVAEAFFSDQRYEAAERYAHRALERAEQLDRLGELGARRVLARCRARQRRAEEAEEILSDTLAIAVSRGSRREELLTELTLAECVAIPTDRIAPHVLARLAREGLAGLGVRPERAPRPR